MKKITLTGLALAAFVFFICIFPVRAENYPPQVMYTTPTPNAEGRIIYVVKPSDTCIRISLLTGIQLDELRRLNNLKEDCTLQEGQQLLLGLAQKTSPQATATPANQVPTPTLPPSSGDICVLLFTDTNGNSIPDGGETPLAGGAISVTDRDGKVSLTDKTNATEPVCFSTLTEGEYNISVAVPEGYNATTLLNYPLKLKGGDKSILDFGAQPGSKAVQPAPGEGGRSPILGIVGAVLVLGGAGLGIYVARFSRRR
jgi:hypothetical protein